MLYSVEELKKKETYQKFMKTDKNELKKLFEDEEGQDFKQFLVQLMVQYRH